MESSIIDSSKIINSTIEEICETLLDPNNQINFDDNTVTGDQEINEADNEKLNMISWFSNAPYIEIEEEPFDEQVKGFTIIPNIKIRIKNYKIDECNNDFIIVRLVSDQIEHQTLEIKETKKNGYSKKRKRNDCLDFISNYDSYIIGTTAVQISYVHTDDENEKGVCLVLDKISLPKFLLTNKNYQYRILITLVKSDYSQWSYNYDPDIYAHLCDKRKMVVDNLNSFSKITSYNFYELSKNITRPFVVVKTVNSLSDRMLKIRECYLKQHPQKGRRKTNLTKLT